MTRDEEAASTSQRQVVNYYDILGRLPPELFNMVVKHLVVEDWRETARNLNRIRGGWRALNDRVYEFTPELKCLNEYSLFAVQVKFGVMANIGNERKLDAEDMHLAFNAAGSVLKILGPEHHRELAERAVKVSDADKRAGGMQGITNHIEHLLQGHGSIMSEADVLVAGWAGDDRLHQVMIAGPGYFDREWFDEWYDNDGDECHQIAYQEIRRNQKAYQRHWDKHGPTSRPPFAFDDDVRAAKPSEFVRKLEQASPTGGYGVTRQRLFILRSVAKGISSEIREKGGLDHRVRQLRQVEPAKIGELERQRSPRERSDRSDGSVSGRE